jgi:hypothetical protein
VQRFERQAWHLDYRQLRCPGLSHPSRQQRTRAVRLLDDKVDTAPVVQSTYHGNAFARTRMLRVLDQNVKGLFLGSMSPSRRGPCPNMN